MTERDTTEIRAALYERLHDEHEEARHEAIAGLSKRRDQHALQPLADALSCDDPWMIDIESAKEMAHPILFPLLLKIKAESSGSTWTDDLLQEAIDCCRPLLA